MKIVVTHAAEKDLYELGSALAIKASAALKRMSAASSPQDLIQMNSRKLVGEIATPGEATVNMFVIRVGELRIIYTLQPDCVVVILAVLWKHDEKQFARELRRRLAAERAIQ
ncbi:MAG TPA: type II toxin-antitoxin system RelE/ParE family toxin [Candidatus Baltobacteraceae bacterium]